MPGEDRLRTPEVEDVLAALLALETPDEAYALLLDMCTVREIQELAQRLHVARLLMEGEHYTRIQELTGASATTISRVSKCVNYGAEGYRTVIERLWPSDQAGSDPHTTDGTRAPDDRRADASAKG